MSRYAIIPACGQSRRMGRPKLLMPWGNSTVIESTLSSWQKSSVDHTVIVIRSDDAELARICRKWECEIIRPADDPPDMRTSIECGLRHIESRFHPAENDAWVLAPADMPEISAAAINRLLDCFSRHDDRIIVPVRDGKRGHTAVFPWLLAQHVFDLPEDVGVNRLLSEHTLETVDEHERGGFFDLDTPLDYRTSRKESGR